MLKKSIVLVFFFITFSCSVFAQGRWAGGRDEDDFHYGYLFRYVSTRYMPYRTANWQDRFYDANTKTYITSDLRNIKANFRDGFGIGMVTNLRLADYADLRLTPTLIFNDRSLTYTYSDGKVIEKNMDYPSLDFPLGLKLRADRHQDYRPYFLIGGVFSLNIEFSASKSNATIAPLLQKIKNSGYYLGYEVGFGVDLYADYFRAALELKVVNSVTNVLIKDTNNVFTNPLEKLLLQNVQVGLIFE